MKNLLNYLKLRDKLLLMYVLSVFIPIVLTNVVFYNVTTSNIRNQKIRDADMALSNLKNDLRVTIDQGLAFRIRCIPTPSSTKPLPANLPAKRNTWRPSILT